MPELLGDVWREWREQHHEVAVHALGSALHAAEFVGANHKRCHTGVVGELLNVLTHFLDELVNRLQRLGTWFLIDELEFVALEEESPKAFEEAVHAVDAVGVPRLACLNGTKEHLIETQGVGTVALHDIIGVDNVEHRLRHLLDCPSADVFVVLENELGVGKLRPPCLELLNVENVVAHDIHIHMDGSGVIVLLEVKRHKLVGVLDAVNEVAATLNHSLVYKFAEWLGLAHIAVVIEEFVPETAVDQVACGVLGTAHIKVNLTPVFVGFLAHEGLVVVGIHIAQIVGAGTCKARHGVKLQRTAVACHPILGASQWWLAGLGWQELVDLWKLQRQFALVKRLWLSVLVVVDGEGLAPVALAAEDGVAQAVVDLHLADTSLGDIFLGLGNGVFHLQTVELQTFVAGVHHYAVFGVETLLADVGTLNQRDDRQVEMACEGIVAAVVCGNRHDGTSAVACKHVVADVDGYLLACDGVDGIAAAEHAAHLLLYEALALGLVLHLVEVGINGCLLLGCHHLLHIFALGSQHHEGHAKDCVGAGGEDEQLLVAAHDGEEHLGSLAATYPVFLCFLDGVTPLDGVEVAQQTAGVGAHAQAPLTHHLLLHGMTTAYRHALAHLIVGEHSTQCRAPVHHCVAQVGDAVVHQHFILLSLSHGVPFLGCKIQFLALSQVKAFGTLLGKQLNQLVDGTCLLGLVAVIALEHLQESPLCPLVVFWFAGAYFAVPVIAETYLVELLTVAGDVLHCSDFGVLTGLDGILFGWQSVGVVAHGMQHVKAFQTLVARIYVAGNVTKRMSHMQTRTAWVGEHVENIELRSALVDIYLVGFVIPPVLLPLFLNLVKIVLHITY